MLKSFKDFLNESWSREKLEEVFPWDHELNALLDECDKLSKFIRNNWNYNLHSRHSRDNVFEFDIKYYDTPDFEDLAKKLEAPIEVIYDRWDEYLRDQLDWFAEDLEENYDWCTGIVQLGKSGGWLGVKTTVTPDHFDNETEEIMQSYQEETDGREIFTEEDMKRLRGAMTANKFGLGGNTKSSEEAAEMKETIEIGERHKKGLLDHLERMKKLVNDLEEIEKSIERGQENLGKEFTDQLTESLTEALVITAMAKNDLFMERILNDAKKSKLIKSALKVKYDNVNFAYKKKFDFQSYNIDKDRFHIGPLHSQPLTSTLKSNDMNPLHIMVTSLDGSAIDKDLVDKILPLEVETQYGDDRKLFTRVLEVDHSNKVAPLSMYRMQDTISSYNPIFIKNVDLYHMIYRYDPVELQKDEITLDMLKVTPEYKSLMDMGLELTSGPKQLKNMTLVFSFPTKYLLDPNDDLYKNENYLDTHYSLYDTGYVRNASYMSGRVAVSRKFNPSTLEGWRDGLKSIKELYEKLFKNYQKKDPEVRFFTSEEDRQKHRGLISSKKFGF